MLLVIQSKRHTKATACQHFVVLTKNSLVPLSLSPSSVLLFCSPRMRISCTFVAHTEPVIIYLWWKILLMPTKILPTFARPIVTDFILFIYLVFSRSFFARRVYVFFMLLYSSPAQSFRALTSWLLELDSKYETSCPCPCLYHFIPYHGMACHSLRSVLQYVLCTSIYDSCQSRMKNEP